MILNKVYLNECNNSFCEELLNMFPLVILMKHFRFSDCTAYIIRKNYIKITAIIPRIEHEISHFVEMNDYSRLLKDDFGFAKDDSGFSKLMNKSSLFAAMVRETRVCAIQKHFMNVPSKNFFINEHWFESAYGYLPYGKFSNKKQIHEWIEHMFKTTYNAWSKDRIYTEWCKRVSYIRDWQETSDGLSL